jgi:hypothetical protein
VAVLSMSKQEFSRLDVLLLVQSGRLRVSDVCGLIGVQRRQVFRLLRASSRMEPRACFRSAAADPATTGCRMRFARWRWRLCGSRRGARPAAMLRRDGARRSALAERSPRRDAARGRLSPDGNGLAVGTTTRRPQEVALRRTMTVIGQACRGRGCN